VTTYNSTELFIRMITPATEGAWGFSASFELFDRETPGAVDCILGNWTHWTGCSSMCGPGERTRHRDVITPARNGGSCSGALDETMACDAGPCGANTTDVDCQVGPWGNYTACSEECGGGIQARARSVLVPRSGLGKECPALEESRECNSQPCSGYDDDDDYGYGDDDDMPSTLPAACSFDETGLAQVLRVGHGWTESIALGAVGADGNPLNHSSYPANSHCVWAVESRPFESVWCKLDSIDIDVTQDCAGDGLSACDGALGQCEAMGLPVCGSSTDAVRGGWNATGSALSI